MAQTDTASLNSLLEVTYRPVVAPGGGELTGEVEVALTNRSSKDIIAYGLVVSAFDPASSSWKSAGFGSMTEDYVTSFAAVGRSAPIDDKYVHLGPIHPGDTIYKRMGLAQDSSAALRFSVTMLNFGDDTALGNAAQIDAVLGRRKAWADEIDAWLPKLRAPGSAGELRRSLSNWATQPASESVAAPPASGADDAERKIEGKFLRQDFAGVATKTDGDLVSWRSFYGEVLSDLSWHLRGHSQRKGD